MAVDMFLKLDGLNGESQDSKHKQEIDILGWSLGMSNTGTAGLGQGLTAGKADFQALTVTKYVDLSSTSLMVSCATGKHIPTATLTCRKAGGDNQLEYLTVTLTEVLVNNIQSGGASSDERTTEMVSLIYEQIKVEYKPQGSTGQAGGGGTPFQYNVAQNKSG